MLNVRVAHDGADILQAELIANLVVDLSFVAWKTLAAVYGRNGRQDSFLKYCNATTVVTMLKTNVLEKRQTANVL